MFSLIYSDESHKRDSFTTSHYQYLEINKQKRARKYIFRIQILQFSVTKFWFFPSQINKIEVLELINSLRIWKKKEWMSEWEISIRKAELSCFTRTEMSRLRQGEEKKRSQVFPHQPGQRYHQCHGWGDGSPHGVCWI